MTRLHRSMIGLVGAIVMTTACGGSSTPPPAGNTGGTGAPAPGNVSMDKNSYAVFPNADAGADSSVPAEQGGKGFTGQGWETSTDFDLVGDPRAVKGGVFRTWMVSFPGTLRMAGPEWNTTLNYMISSLVYESLLTLHPTTLRYVPALATHWQIAPDKKTYRFRIDPNARFSDGTPVTAEDVVASWSLLADKSLQDLFFYTEMNKLVKPVAESKYIVRFVAKDLSWRNFLIASFMRVFPAHVLKTVNAKSYLTDYNFKLLPGTGPYHVADADIRKGTSVSIRRRNDYWGANYRANIGQYNFDEIRYTVVRDQNLAFEQFKRGDLDYYVVNISQQWMQEFNFEDVQRGLVVKRKVFNNYPANRQSLAFNTRREPWNDVRVRKAFALLLNRELLIKTLFFNEYVPQNSYYPATAFENPSNPKNEYNPQEAIRLLAEAGWKDRDAQGRLVKNGRPLQIELLYSDKGSERWLTIYQQDLRKVGIGLNLRLVNPETHFKMMMQRQFELISAGWGSGSVFPIPRPEYHSEGADINNTNNITGFKNKRVDEICEQYELEFDPAKRAVLLRELDGILANEHHNIMEWTQPAHRFAYWNRFGMPVGIFSRVGDYDGSLGQGMPQLWWVDPAQSQRTEQARSDKSIKMPPPAIEDRYWQEFAKKESMPAAVGQ